MSRTNATANCQRGDWNGIARKSRGDVSTAVSRSAAGTNASGLLYKLSKQAGLGIKRFDLFNERSSHRLHPVEYLVRSILDS
jgi:hypothetical protein